MGWQRLGILLLLVSLLGLGALLSISLRFGSNGPVAEGPVAPPAPAVGSTDGEPKQATVRQFNENPLPQTGAGQTNETPRHLATEAARRTMSEVVQVTLHMAESWIPHPIEPPPGWDPDTAQAAAERLLDTDCGCAEELILVSCDEFPCWMMASVAPAGEASQPAFGEPGCIQDCMQQFGTIPGRPWALPSPGVPAVPDGVFVFTAPLDEKEYSALRAQYDDESLLVPAVGASVLRRSSDLWWAISEGSESL